MTLPILVTGGTGRLGRRVVRRLLAAGCGIWVLTRHGRRAADGVQFLTSDLRTSEGVDAAAVEPGRRRSAGDEHGEAGAAAVGGPE